MNEASVPDKEHDESQDGAVNIPIETADGQRVSDLEDPAETVSADPAAADVEVVDLAEAAAEEVEADGEPVVATSKLSEAITALQVDKQQTYDRLLRTAAEFENFKKRSRRDKQEASERAEDRVVMACLPVIDNLERALEHGGVEFTEAEAGIASGVRMVHKQFVGILGQFGITAFDSIGEPFDPELHEAVQQMPSDFPKNSVMTELQRGYRRSGKLVRPAMVVVSQGPLNTEAPEGDSPDDAASADLPSETES